MLKMKMDGKVTQIEEKISKKGNEYVIVYIAQDGNWLRVMAHQDIENVVRKIEAGTSVSAVLKYNPKWKSFVLVAIEKR